ncbi:MAG: MFS transporter [Acidimicrobiaceae bacterium]|nr:MFS transporter [Acidimicrobiaceae bacterium]
MVERALARRGPFANSYPAAVGLVALALVPFLMLTAAALPLSSMISRSLGISPGALDLTTAMSDAAYAFGTVLAVQFAMHRPARRMLLLYVTGFVVASALAAWAPTASVFIGAFVVQGLCTSLMLIAAVPPLVTGWPPAKMPITGATMNLCIFGAVAIGPTIGGLQAAAGGWRPLFWVVTGLGVLALVMSLLTFEDVPPADREAPRDIAAIALAGVGCAAGFYGAGRLQSGRSADLVAVVPLVVGVALVVVLVTHQYRVREPLMPVEQLATTVPVTGILIALFASASAFGLMVLLLEALQQHHSPGRVALLFLPEFGAAVATAALFAALFRTRFTPVLALGGLMALAAGAALATGVPAHGNGMMAAAAAVLIGLGVGASVSPSLFMAGFSLRSAQLQRVFAMLELLRGVTAFLVAPILVFFVSLVGTNEAAGLRDAIWVCLGLAVAGFVLAAAVFVAGRGRLQNPDLERWEEGEPAWESPPLWGRLRASRARQAVR